MDSLIKAACTADLLDENKVKENLLQRAQTYKYAGKYLRVETLPDCK